MASDRSIFQFNILPAKTAQEKAIELEKNNSTKYGLVLAIFSLIILVVSSMAQDYIIMPRYQEATALLTQRLDTVSSYDTIRSVNGELFIKTKTLEPVLEKNIDTNRIFTLADEIKSAAPNLVVESYSRELTGTFVFVVLSPNLESVSTIMEKTLEIKDIRNVFLRTVVTNADTGITSSTIALDIIVQ